MSSLSFCLGERLERENVSKTVQTWPSLMLLRFSRRMPLAISIELNLRLTASADICLLFLEEGKSHPEPLP